MSIATDKRAAQPADRLNSGVGGLIIGPPCCESGEGALAKRWWDYDIIAKRALGVTALDGFWPRDWPAVTHVVLGALAASRLVFIGVADVKELLSHPYVARQVKLGRVAVYLGKATPRHGATHGDITRLQRELLAAASHLDLFTLDNVNDVLAWKPGVKE